MSKGRKHEHIVTPLENYPRLHTDLVIVGREDEHEKFPNSDSKFLIRKFVMNQDGNRRRADVWEISMSLEAAEDMAHGIIETVTKIKGQLAPAAKKVAGI